MRSPDSDAAAACDLIGPNPKGAVRRVSLAVRHAIMDLQDSGARFVLIGFSGGADSAALTVAAIDAAVRAGLPAHTLTVDHALRPESAEEASQAAHTARALGAIATTCRIDVEFTAFAGGGPEAAARAARRDALVSYAHKLHAHYGGIIAPILLGHTMDDQAETVLLRLARGSGASSLKAMSPKRREGDTVWVRPLLGMRRAELRDALHALGVEWVEDPTNEPDGPWTAADGSPLRRAAIRATAIPVLTHTLGMDPVPGLARTARLSAVDDEALTSIANDVYARAVQQAPTGAISAQVIAAQPQAIQTRALRKYLLAAGSRPGDLSSHHIDTVRNLVVAWRGQGPLYLPNVTVHRLGKGKDAHLLAVPTRARPPAVAAEAAPLGPDVAL